MKEILVYDNTLGAKTFKVSASLVLSQLAVHRSIDRNGKAWKVTHLETGGVLADSDSYAAAVKMARRLNELDWSKVKSAKSKKALAELAPAVIDIRAEFA